MRLTEPTTSFAGTSILEETVTTSSISALFSCEITAILRIAINIDAFIFLLNKIFVIITPR